MNQFQQWPIGEPFLEALTNQGITEPTEIQQQVIPEALDGQNLIVHSQTGTGKTLAYLLPLLTKTEELPEQTQALILAPTQELAMQIVEVAKQLTATTSITVLPLIGGANLKRQVEKLKKKKPHVAVGTPGRILELMEMKKLKVPHVKMIVVDEADRMMEETSAWNAFENVAKRIGNEAQYLFVSATFASRFTELVAPYVPFIETVSAQGNTVQQAVNHWFIRCEKRERMDVVRKLIHHENIQRGIVFVNRLEHVAETTAKLQFKGIKAVALSSDQTKQERERALHQLKTSEAQVLIASDVAARGLDVDDVSHVIQLEPPTTSEVYVHRAGRTGRMGKEGTVITLTSEREMYKLEKIEKGLNLSFEERVLSHGKLHAKNNGLKGHNKRKK
ncbi:DEAD/DEAH box helicase [Halalkalibacterium halodurans]|uniref:DEAD/DEAH box helicase n=1 Tax=Halalkalibacterium halodurans TaxID=86665 RepID=UPI002E1EAE3C|nr:DEAD/DEAH box helicase [Halalkalibacterium halodurans]